MEYAITYRDGVVVCHSSIPWCGYTLEILKDMEAAGYRLMVDGRRVKCPSAALYKEAAKNG